jgi:hypothetical protein
VQFGREGLVFGRHASSLSVHGPRKSESSARVFYRQANSEEGDEGDP